MQITNLGLFGVTLVQHYDCVTVEIRAMLRRICANTHNENIHNKLKGDLLAHF